ncbi:hypothetical protein BN1221_01669c [Brenneria goodwinii]|uniref:Uncharacterized protein n=1 Tax=Brenneria goodwinii TaxID=1109412 RepID=A0A0G4JU54_9GAMM|nr:hypothetical protein BN1221_01669c [Brenneria goodwinii]
MIGVVCRQGEFPETAVFNGREYFVRKNSAILIYAIARARYWGLKRRPL